jgi:hypothetical protein
MNPKRTFNDLKETVSFDHDADSISAGMKIEGGIDKMQSIVNHIDIETDVTITSRIEKVLHASGTLNEALAAVYSLGRKDSEVSHMSGMMESLLGGLGRGD